MTFQEEHVKILTGGRFKFDGEYKTVADLRRALQAMDAEMATWGDKCPISSVFLDRQNQSLDVVIENGPTIT